MMNLGRLSLRFRDGGCHQGVTTFDDKRWTAPLSQLPATVMNSAELVEQTLETIQAVSTAYRNATQQFASDENALSILRGLGRALDRVRLYLASGMEDEEYCQRLDEITIADVGGNLLISLYLDSMQISTYLQNLAGVGNSALMNGDANQYTDALIRYGDAMETVQKKHQL
jgi:hypothetical protein